MARKLKERQLKNPTVTIIGEGVTEKFYFTHLKVLNGYNYVCKPRNFIESSLHEMQKQIERVLEDRGIAICVFDLDITRESSTNKSLYSQMKQRYATNKSREFGISTSLYWPT